LHVGRSGIILKFRRNILAEIQRVIGEMCWREVMFFQLPAR
jgi:hypothetical protein